MRKTAQAPDAEVEAAWDAEIKRRIDEINAGTAKFVSSEEVFAKAYKIIEQSRLRATEQAPDAEYWCGSILHS